MLAGVSAALNAISIACCVGGSSESKSTGGDSFAISLSSVRTFEQTIEKHPTYPIAHAVRGMLQHNTLGADQLRRLRVYAGAQHRHEAQQPQPITFGELGEIIRATE